MTIFADVPEIVCSRCQEPLWLEDAQAWCVNVECSMCRVVFDISPVILHASYNKTFAELVGIGR